MCSSITDLVSVAGRRWRARRVAPLALRRSRAAVSARRVHDAAAASAASRPSDPREAAADTALAEGGGSSIVAEYERAVASSIRRW